MNKTKKCYISTIILFLILIININAITFNPPTPPNASTYYSTSIYVNVSSFYNSSSNIFVFIDFDNSLISWWRMDDLNASGGLVDYTGKNNGTIVGAVQNSSGKMGKSYTFNSAGEYVDFGNPASLQIGNNPQSIFAWVKLTPQTGTNSQYIYSTRDASVGELSFAVSYAGYMLAWIGTTSQNIDTSANLHDNTWHYIGLTYNKSQINYYRDGINTFNDTTLSGSWSTTANKRIGTRVGSTLFSPNGTVDDLMIFKRTLSSDEVKGLYANTPTKHLGVNFIDLHEGIHIFKAYMQDNIGNVDSTETRYVFLNASLNYNETYPTFSDYWDNNASLVNSGIGYFNVTVNNTNGTVILNIDNQSILASNLTANVFNVPYTFTRADVYSYNWTAYGNGTDNNLNVSDTRNYFVNFTVETNVLSTNVITHTALWKKNFASRIPYDRSSFYMNGRYWLIYGNTTDGNTSYISSTDGITWTNPIKISTYNNKWDADWSIATNGSVVDYYYQLANNATHSHIGMNYTRGTPLANGTITWGTVYTIISSTTVTDDFTASIDPYGYPWLSSAGKRYSSKYNNGTWETNTTRSQTASPFQVMGKLNDGQMYFTGAYWRVDSAMQGELWNGTDYVNEGYITGSVEGNSGFGTYVGRISAVGCNGIFHIAYQGSDQTIKYLKRYSNGTLSPIETIDNYHVQAEISHPALTCAENNAGIYVFWDYTTPIKDYILVSYNNGTMWNTPRQIISGDFEETFGHVLVYEEQVNKMIGLTYLTSDYELIHVLYNATDNYLDNENPLNNCNKADINKDGIVNDKDAAILGAHWNITTTDPFDIADINKDGIVDYKDASMIGSYWLQKC